MLDIIRKSAPEKIKALVADTSLTDRERCAKLYAYLTQKIDDPKVRVQTEASVSSEGRHYHVILKDQTWRGLDVKTRPHSVLSSPTPPTAKLLSPRSCDV